MLFKVLAQRDLERRINGDVSSPAFEKGTTYYLLTFALAGVP
jgi:hypothetical protein